MNILKQIYKKKQKSSFIEAHYSVCSLTPNNLNIRQVWILVVRTNEWQHVFCFCDNKEAMIKKANDLQSIWYDRIANFSK